MTPPPHHHHSLCERIRQWQVPAPQPLLPVSRQDKDKRPQRSLTGEGVCVWGGDKPLKKTKLRPHVGGLKVCSSTAKFLETSFFPWVWASVDVALAAACYLPLRTQAGRQRKRLYSSFVALSIAHILADRASSGSAAAIAARRTSQSRAFSSSSAEGGGRHRMVGLNTNTRNRRPKLHLPISPPRLCFFPRAPNASHGCGERVKSLLEKKHL